MTGTVTISVRLFGILRDRLPARAERGTIEMSVPVGARVGPVLAALGISPESEGHLVIMVNGRQVGLEHRLRAGDVVSAFLALAGG